MAEWNSRTEPYPYPWGGQGRNMPNSRVGRRGTVDAGLHVLNWKAHARRDFQELRPNPRYERRRIWPVVDSLGRRICWVELHSNRWDIHLNPDGPPVYADYKPDEHQFELQGRGAMKTAALERRHALVSFNANSGDDFWKWRFRGFISRNALPIKNNRGQKIRSVVDDYDTKGGGSRLAVSETINYPDPAFGPDERFYGTDGIRRSYSTYNIRHGLGEIYYLMMNTTGVRGGGIVRAVLRAADALEVQDWIAYSDPNGMSPVRWRYCRVRGVPISGWTIQRA